MAAQYRQRDWRAELTRLQTQVMETVSGWGARGAMPDEAVHDLRLALRAQRTLWRLPRPRRGVKAWRSQLGEWYRQAAQARDLEVGLQRLQSLALTEDCAPLLQRWRQRLQTARRKLRARLNITAMTSALADGEALLAVAKFRDKDDLRRRARQQARRLRREVRSCAKAVQGVDDEQGWHALRKSIKHYRIWALQLGGLLQRRHRQRADKLKSLQLGLGEWHDWAVLAGRLEAEGAPETLCRQARLRQQQALAALREAL